MPANLSSEIDSTFPANNVPVDKADLRAQFTAIKNAIAAVEQRSTLAYLIVTGQVRVTE